MSNIEQPSPEYYPYIRKPYLEGLIIDTPPFEVGREYILHIVHGGQASVRPTDKKELRQAQEDLVIGAQMNSVESGKATYIRPPQLKLSDLPPLCIEETEAPERVFTEGVLESLEEDTDPAGRKVHVLTIREIAIEDPRDMRRNAFEPGTLIHGWCFPDENSFHILTVNQERVDGIDTSLDLTLEPISNFYNQ